jgi:hypothetical protein
MRSVILLILCFFIIALLWTVQLPISSYGLVQTLGQDQTQVGADISAVERELVVAGDAAVPALKAGLKSPLSNVRLRCARLLAMRNESAGEELLLDALHSNAANSGEEAAATAEVFLLSVWDQRDGPAPAIRARLARLEATRKDADQIALLSECLSRNSAWIGGYIHRARAYFRSGEVMEARRDALIALALDANQFESMQILSQVFLMLNSPQDAYLCLEQAVRINPRLKTDLRDDIRDVLKAIDAEKDRRRREHRRETPAV